jgi:hypothetical protein
MAKGFVTLRDGRLWWMGWRGYDLLLGLIIKALGPAQDEQQFKAFLRELVPPPDMPQSYEMGVGFVRPADDETVYRILDLRSLTPHYQEVFWRALQRAYTRIMLGAPHEGTPFFAAWVRELLRVRQAVARGQLWSDQIPMPFPDERIGPGWEK